jgi:Flp pilus assembly pilin Flp
MNETCPTTATKQSDDIRRVWRDRGASVIEYALLLALIAVVCVAAIGVLGQTVSESIEDDAQQLYDAGR